MGALRAEYRGAVAEIRVASVADVDAVFDLLTARSRAAFGISQVERAHVETELATPNSDAWLALDDDGPVGFARLAPTQTLVLAARDPDVNDALLARAEAAGRARGYDHLIVYAVPEDEPLWALVERSAFVHDRDVLRMWRMLDGELPEPRWPEGVRVRTYEAADGEAVQALLDAQYGSWDESYVRMPHEDWLVFMTQHAEFDPALWFLVERDDDLVACALHWREHERRGWVKDIVVAERERGRGLGKALLYEAFRAYEARGADRVGLKVDSTNPTGALQLYEKVGFVVDQRQAIWKKEL
jgi:ribosomal protein S18 acetylase RimI-like enzyme